MNVNANLPLSQPHRIGSELIYLQPHCYGHCRCRSVNDSISYNGIQLLRQENVAVAVPGPCERTFKTVIEPFLIDYITLCMMVFTWDVNDNNIIWE